uniref:Uncharacterized protein n=1 Tax=Seriola lalandi dorsalis TaxID=1841481 RepID=A0A3B4Y4R9_SERLL
SSKHIVGIFSSGTAIILEGRIVMDDLENLPHAMCLFFGLTYALNLEYPQQLKNTFDFIQRVLLSLGHKSLKPKIQSLKNLLMKQGQEQENTDMIYTHLNCFYWKYVSVQFHSGNIWQLISVCHSN